MFSFECILVFVLVDFFNWNRVVIRYCDGASFAGHPEAEFKVIKTKPFVSGSSKDAQSLMFLSSQNGTGLFFRGQLIWEAIMDELLLMGMSDAKQVNILMIFL